jgi:hypothetical protein
MSTTMTSDEEVELLLRITMLEEYVTQLVANSTIVSEAVVKLIKEKM